MSCVILVCGGVIENVDFLAKQINEIKSQYTNVELFAVDGGANALFSANIEPNVFVGDFDSINIEVKTWVEKNVKKVFTFPVKKDKTDTELAIDICIDKGLTNVFIFGATGGRLDHFLSVGFLLEKFIEYGVQPYIIDECNLMTILAGKNNKLSLKLKKYKYLSLLALSDEVNAVYTQNTKYKVNGLDISRISSKFVSNEIENRSKEVLIKIGNGKLLVIASND